MARNEAHRQAQHRWYVEVMRKRRDDWFKVNGPCRKCGSWENLELDHIDPSQKEHHTVWSWAKERREKELAKCQALCEDCHKKKSAEEKRKPVIHGTRDGYVWHHCRCELCVQVASEYRNEQRYRTGKRKRPDAGLVQRQESLLGME